MKVIKVFNALMINTCRKIVPPEFPLVHLNARSNPNEVKSNEKSKYCKRK